MAVSKGNSHFSCNPEHPVCYGLKVRNVSGRGVLDVSSRSLRSFFFFFFGVVSPGSMGTVSVQWIDGPDPEAAFSPPLLLQAWLIATTTKAMMRLRE